MFLSLRRLYMDTDNLIQAYYDALGEHLTRVQCLLNQAVAERFEDPDFSFNDRLGAVSNAPELEVLLVEVNNYFLTELEKTKTTDIGERTEFAVRSGRRALDAIIDAANAQLDQPITLKFTKPARVRL